MHDPLTNLLDRGEYDAHLPAAIHRAQELGAPLALLILDLDHFGKVNNDHGHARGDEALRTLAQILRSVTAHKGAAYRYGGEEFAVILENFDLQEALAVAERIRREMEAARIEGIPKPVTLCAGVAIHPEHADCQELLFEAADDAMYTAKKRGRNLVQYYGEPAPQVERRKRVVERRQAEGRALPAEQRRAYRKILLQGREDDVPVCPRDGTPLDVEDVTPPDSVVREFVITCPACGLRERLSPED